MMKFPHGEMVIGDCIECMELIPDNMWDLGFIDPPWGHDYDGKRPMGINARVYKEKNVNYKDKFDPEWNMEWWGHVTRVCTRVVMAMGWKHFNWWVKNTDPVGYFFWYFKNGQGQSKVCNHNSAHPLLCYGDWKKRDRKFRYNCRETYIPNGFLRIDGEDLCHPSPKPYRDWRLLIEELNPTSVFDCFAGSGTIGEVAESMGIPWMGIELDAKGTYVEDIRYRVNKGIKRFNKIYKPVIKPTIQKPLFK